MKNLLIILLAFSVTLSFGQNANTFNFVIETTEDKTEYKFLVDNAVNLEVDWGNGSSDTYNGTTSPTHDFGEAGLWTIKVSGQASRISFWTVWPCEYAEMLRDILTPVSDGVTGITNVRDMFRGTKVESFTAEDFLNDIVPNVTSLYGLFNNSSFNQDIGAWDVSNVSNMSDMFRSSGFNQDISSWNVSNVSETSYMFAFSPFNQPLANWDVSNVTGMSNMFQGSNFNQDIGAWDVSNVNNMNELFSDSDFNQDISTWEVGNVTNMNGLFSNTQFNHDIGRWDVRKVTSMSSMFQRSSFNQDIGAWDVSNVTDMSFMFQRSDFNQDISNWDVSKVTNMRIMFGDSDFNQDIGSWDVSKVTNMLELFDRTPFNRDISSWDVSNVTNMMRMFRNSEFNQDIGAWDVSSVTNMHGMFSGSVFNQDIGNWDVSNVTTMQEMFYDTDFNQDIDGWDVSNVTNMIHMFSLSSFNSPLASWDVSKVTEMNGMFWGTDFNQDISGWDVSNVTNMQDMFYNGPFNQDISGWDVSSVTNMNSMFSYSYFNQDISIWDVSNVENFEYFLNNSELSTENYNKMLIKWSELDLQQDISFYGGSSKYDLGLPEDRRQHIIDAFGWTFNDGGNTGNEVFLLTLYANPQDGGEVEGEGLYYEDDNIDLKAIANLGYDFTSWTDGNDEEVDSDPEFVFVMPAETVTLTANFALVDYQLTVNIDPEGAGNVSGEGIYNMNDEVTLEATANDGYEFVSWNNGEEILSVNAFYVLTMPANHINLSANFSVITSISEEPLFGHSISIYPNPTKSHIYIEGVKGNSSIEVISITGKKMMQRENQSGKVYLDVSCLDNGIYILKISSKIGVLSKKVFINR